MAVPKKVNLAEKLSLFSEHFHPKIVGELNDSHVKVVKLQGEFVWHHHEAEDEMFLVLKGTLHIRFRDGEVSVEPGEFLIVTKGVEHCPYATEEVHLVLLEPKSTVNTCNVASDRTAVPEWI